MRSSKVPAAALLAIVLAACDPGVSLGERCERSGQCAAPLVCELGRCRTECVESRDCPLESECVLSEGSGVCRLPADVCARDEDCPAPLHCGTDGVCRATCTRDAQCAPGSRCVVQDEELLCVRERDAPDGGVDAGADAGGDGGPPPSCRGEGTQAFDNGLADWCVVASPGLSVTGRLDREVAGIDGAAMRFDLDGAPAGSWIRIHQDMDLREHVVHSFAFASLSVTSGAIVVGLEALDATGALVGRAAIAQASADVADPCAVTGRAGLCRTGAVGLDMAAPLRALAGLDLREVVTLRRFVEVIAGPASGASATIDGVAENVASCSLGWWRAAPDLALLETLDRPWSMLGTGLSWTGPVPLFAETMCGNAVTLDGTTRLERATPLDLGAGPITLGVAWHPPIEEAFPLTGDRVLFEQTDGSLSLAIRGGRWVARMGSCGAMPALVATDPAVVTSDDRRFQEIQLLADWAGARVCIYRNGHLAACDDVPACPLGAAPAASPSRFAVGFTGAIDEIRIQTRADVPRDASTRTGRCHLDRSCIPYGTSEVRDVGSGECVAPAACTSIATCPERAATPAFSCGSTASVACGLDPTCPDGVAECGASCTYAVRCADDVAASCM